MGKLKKFIKKLLHRQEEITDIDFRNFGSNNDSVFAWEITYLICDIEHARKISKLEIKGTLTQAINLLIKRWRDSDTFYLLLPKLEFKILLNPENKIIFPKEIWILSLHQRLHELEINHICKEYSKNQ